MPGKPHDAETVERAIELVAGGMRTKFAARELGVPMRTVSEWIGKAAQDGRLESARARLREAQGEPAGAEPPDNVVGSPASPERPRRAPRPSRLDVLHDALARLTATAASDFEDPRTRVQAEGTIGRIVELIDRMTQGEDVAAEIEGLALTAAEARSCVTHVQELRARAKESPVVTHARINAGVDALVDDLIDGLARIPAHVDEVSAILAEYADRPRLSGVEGQAGQWGGFAVWRRVLSAIPARTLAVELESPGGEALAELLEGRLTTYRARRAEAEANRKAHAEAEATRARLAREQAARWVSDVERDVLRGPGR